jgi:hypothetical protein
MNGLRGIEVENYEFLRPTAGDPGFSAWEKAAAVSQGVPGLDPFPALSADDTLRLLPGEEQLSGWVATSLHWSNSSRAKNSRLPASGEVVKSGKVSIVLTDRRLAIIVPQEYINYQGTPGQGATIAPTMTDRVKLRAIRRVGGKIAPRLVDELLGDMSPRVGHVPLDGIATLTAVNHGNGLAIGFEIVGTDPLAASLRLGLRERNAGQLVDSIVTAIRKRWAQVDLTDPLLEIVRASSCQSTESGVTYRAPLHRPVGSRMVTVVDGSSASFEAPPDLTPTTASA